MTRIQQPSSTSSTAQRPAKPRTRVAWYVLSSHWDREWYRTFQVFRAQLVALLDDVLERFVSGTSTGPFYCDGQAIVLEDYLEIRPERRALLAEALREKAIVAGPWYNLPDEFLVSGESLIRNIRRGRELVRSFGAEPSDAGFLCDLFGHNSQMPQLLRGFGITGGQLWRGLNAHSVRHVKWRGADGTELPCYRFGTNGYWGVAVHVGAFTDHAGKQDMSPQAVRERLKRYIDVEAQLTEIDDVLVFHGPDHFQINPAFEAALKVLLADQDDTDFELRHASLDDYQASMLRQADRIKTVVEGELLEPGKESIDVEQQWLTGGTLASRPWIKQQNCKAQAQLCHWAEPWTWAARTAGLPTSPTGLLDRAWKYLLQNHPHDSICGCSIDAVHEDMAYRFRQCLDLSGVITDTATRGFAQAITLTDESPDEHRVVVFNPLPRATDEVIELELHVPTDWPVPERFHSQAEPYVNLRLRDADNREVAFQRLGQAHNQVRLDKQWHLSPDKVHAHRLRLAVRADVPALGYTTLRVAPALKTDAAHGEPSGPGLALDDRTIGNEHLTVTVESDGTLSLCDLRTGQSYRRLLAFEDRGDIGDGWVFEPPLNDQTFSSAGASHQVSIVEDGPLQATLRLRVEMRLPAGYDNHAQRRSDRFETLVIDNRITLRARANRVDVSCTVDNHIRDHRLRVVFPTGCDATRYLADTPFDVVERSIALRPDNADYRDRELETKPQQSWCAVHDAAPRGLAVVTAGLMESTVRDLPGRPIALTLLRATQRTVFTDGEPGGQVQGQHTFRFSVVPLAGTPDRAALTELGQRLNAGPHAVQLAPRDRRHTPPPPVALPPTYSHLTLDGPAIVTSIRPDGDAVEVRLFNPQTVNIACGLKRPGAPGTGAPGWRAQPVDLESRPIGEALIPKRGAVSLTLGPKKIVTLRLEPSGT